LLAGKIHGIAKAVRRDQLPGSHVPLSLPFQGSGDDIDIADLGFKHDKAMPD
jgi:hypothetical protein